MSRDALVALARDLGLGDAPEPILERISALYREIDAEVAAAAHGLELPCRAGCDACCHEAVFVSAPELLAVAAHLLEHVALEDRRALVAQMTEISGRFADELELLETIPPGEERDEVAARVKFRCPLLGLDGLCSVYGARELNARTFGQTWDAQRGAPYGCELTHARLRVLQPEPALFDAREARRRLRDAVPSTALVHVYPWWFAKYGHHLL